MATVVIFPLRTVAFIEMRCIFLRFSCDVITVDYMIFVPWFHTVKNNVMFLPECVVKHQSECSQADEKGLLSEDSHDERGCHGGESHGHDLSQAGRYAQKKGEEHPKTVPSL